MPDRASHYRHAHVGEPLDRVGCLILMAGCLVIGWAIWRLGELAWAILVAMEGG